MKTITFIVLISIGSFLISCKKDTHILKSLAILNWTGDYEVGGCGYFLTIDGQKYKPENESIIDNSFKTPQNPVKVEYQLLNKKFESACGAPTKTDGIKIISIVEAFYAEPANLKIN